jgi:hypothetical protein
MCCCRIVVEELNKNVKYFHQYSWFLGRGLIQGNARDINMMMLVIIMVIMGQVVSSLMKVKTCLEEYCIINSRAPLFRALVEAHLVVKLKTSFLLPR